MKTKINMLTMSLIMVFGFLLIITGFEKPVEAKAADDYPSYLKAAARDALVDPYNFYNRECTSFCAFCLNERNGVAFHNYYLQAHFGNAGNWINAAKSVGIKVDNTPAVGSIACWVGGDTGHVAWVSEVKGDTVVIEEYNYNYSGNYNTREIKASSPTGYIHFKDIPQEVYLDLNWEVDGKLICTEVPCATVDVYIDGKRVAKGVSDYYAKWPVGTKYTIKNIKTTSGYTYNGVVLGTLKGNVGNQDTEVRLSFSTKTVIYDGKWKLASSGTWVSCSIPSGFDSGHALATKYKSTPLSNYETSTQKVVVSEKKLIGYVYYHWTHNKYSLPNNNYNVLINDHYCWEGRREYYNFRAFFSSVNYSHVDRNGIYGGEDCYYAWLDNPADGSWWWFRVPVYEQTYKLYEVQNVVNGRVGPPTD